MIAVVVMIRPAGNVRGRQIAVRVAGMHSVSGAGSACRSPWDHAMDFLGNAMAAVAAVRDRLNPSLSVVVGSGLAPGRRVWLLDLIYEKG